jgi:DNA-binding NarL/FixJ family response regulator
MISVLVVDDQTLVRSGISQILSHAADIDVIGDAANGSEAVEKTLRLRPDVVLMDVRMPAMDGLEATKRIIAQRPETKVIVLTTFELDEYVFGAVRAGASGFLLKDIDPDSLRQAVKVVAEGNALLSPSVTRRVIAEFAETTGDLDDSVLDQLTPREVEVLALVGKGRSNDEIAEELFISASTAKTHVNRAMMKLGVHDRAQLVVIAYETGLIRPGQG